MKFTRIAARVNSVLPYILVYGFAIAFMSVVIWFGGGPLLRWAMNETHEVAVERYLDAIGMQAVEKSFAAARPYLGDEHVGEISQRVQLLKKRGEDVNDSYSRVLVDIKWVVDETVRAEMKRRGFDPEKDPDAYHEGIKQLLSEEPFRFTHGIVWTYSDIVRAASSSKEAAPLKERKANFRGAKERMDDLLANS